MTVVCLIIGYPVAYFLAVKVKKVQYSFALFIIALAPFFTSTLIGAEAWSPTMGKQGAVNQILQKIGIINHPLSILLFSDFAVRVSLIAAGPVHGHADLLPARGARPERDRGGARPRGQRLQGVHALTLR